MNDKRKDASKIQELQKTQIEENEKHVQTIQNIQNSLVTNNQPINGSDDDERPYRSIVQLWKVMHVYPPTAQECKNKDNNDESYDSDESWYWYEQAHDHYDTQPATLQGMLGGFANLSPHDLSSSEDFLLYIQKNILPNLKFDSVCDCGAGIGRITKGLFWKLPGFRKCDLIEGSALFLKQAEIYLNKNVDCHIVTEETNNMDINLSGLPICRLISKGLQDFYPVDVNYYDVVWIQWVIGYLHDYDCVSFFKRCSKALKDNGILCIKDNMINSNFDNHRDRKNDEDAFILDREDSSITRSKAYLEAIIEESGCWTKVYEVKQEGFPKEIFPVWMMAFQVKR